MSWTCNGCGTQDPALRYPSGKMKRCMDCQRFYNITVNAKRARTHSEAPGLNITKAEFLAWVRSQDRSCFYCGVSEADLPLLGLVSQIGHPVQALGIDRLDANVGYKIGNIELCCFACNKAKGNVFSTEEMGRIGEAISTVWNSRLSD